VELLGSPCDAIFFAFAFSFVLSATVTVDGGSLPLAPRNMSREIECAARGCGCPEHSLDRDRATSA